MSYNFKKYLRETLRSDYQRVLKEQLGPGIMPKPSIGLTRTGRAGKGGGRGTARTTWPGGGGGGIGGDAPQFPDCDMCNDPDWNPVFGGGGYVYTGPNGAIGFYFPGPPPIEMTFGGAIPIDFGEGGNASVMVLDGELIYIQIMGYNGANGYFDSNGVFIFEDPNTGEPSIPDDWDPPCDGCQYYIIPGQAGVYLLDADGNHTYYEVPMDAPPTNGDTDDPTFIEGIINWWNSLSQVQQWLIIVGGVGLAAWGLSEKMQEEVQRIIDQIRGKKKRKLTVYDTGGEEDEVDDGGEEEVEDDPFEGDDDVEDGGEEEVEDEPIYDDGDDPL